MIDFTNVVKLNPVWAAKLAFPEVELLESYESAQALKLFLSSINITIHNGVILWDLSPNGENTVVGKDCFSIVLPDGSELSNFRSPCIGDWTYDNVRYFLLQAGVILALEFAPWPEELLQDRGEVSSRLFSKDTRSFIERNGNASPEEKARDERVYEYAKTSLVKLNAKMEALAAAETPESEKLRDEEVKNLMMQISLNRDTKPETL